MKIKIIFFIVVIIGLGLVGWRIVKSRGSDEGSRGGKDRGAAAVPVNLASAIRKPMPVEIRTFGTVQPYASVTVKSQVTGVITNVHFSEGQEVKRGDLLLTLDTRPFQASLKQAESVRAKDTAQRINADKELRRQEDLRKKGISSEGEYDLAKTAVESLAATVQADEAAVDNAALQLDYCFIRSPIDGRTGELKVMQGNLVKANDMTLLTIHQIRPTYISFAVPQRYLPDIINRITGDKLVVQVVIPGDKSGKPEKGEVSFVDNAVDAMTGTIVIKGLFANPEGKLWPGQFVNVILTLEIQADAIVTPAQVVMTGQNGQYVYVVKPDMTVELRTVKVDRVIDNDAVIAEGLKEGETAVMDGQLKLASGVKVEAKQPGDGKAEH